jgi:hypothetical protein
MNSTIGITQWYNNETEFPLKGAGNSSGIFCDASFLTYDGFVPSLVSIQLTETKLQINILMDDGVQTFSFDKANLHEGKGVRLKSINTGRSYGSLVFGRLTETFLLGILGNNLNPNCRFDPCVVRAIDASSGIFTINGLSGDVTVNLSDLQFNDTYTATPAFHAVTNPTKLDTVVTDANHVYLYTSLRKVIKVTDALEEIGTLDKEYNVLYNVTHSNEIHLVGMMGHGSNSRLYPALNTLPTTSIDNDIPGHAVSLVYDNSGGWVYTDDGVIHRLGSWDYFPSYSAISDPLSHIDITNPKGMVYFNNKYIAFTDGPKDYSPGAEENSYFSSMFYLVDLGDDYVNGIPVTPLGIMSDGATTPNLHMPWLSHIYIKDGKLHGCSTHNGQLVLYEINLDSLKATPIFTAPYNEELGGVSSVFVGGSVITFNKISPLKSLNSTTAYSNRLNILGSDTMSISQTSSNTLVFNLPIADDVLNVSRSKVYEYE